MAAMRRATVKGYVTTAVAAALLAACAPVSSGGGTSAGASSSTAEAGLDNLNAVLWLQRSVEHRGTALQAFALARRALDDALGDPTWTAALEQTGTFADLPPAVILDIDETVLDNGSYEARLTLDREVHTTEAWDSWVHQEAATPVPGAFEFCNYAATTGVRVFYVTNRRAHLRESTVANLVAEGFPLAPDSGNLLMRADIPEWDTADKGSRRRKIASEYRILLLIGDNMGDFVSAASGNPEERAAFAEEHREWWGTRWITLANPTYGSWLGAVIDYDYSLSLPQQLRLKEEALDPKR